MVRVVGILRSLEQVPPRPDRQAIAAGLEDGRLGHRIRRADHEVRDIGRLLGLSDLAVMPTDLGSADLGFILIANPLDKRPDWPVSAPSLVGFLERLVDADGDSFWAHG